MINNTFIIFIVSNAFISIKLCNIDLCYSLLNGLPKYSIHRLQKIQCTTAQIVSHTARFSYTTPTL